MNERIRELAKEAGFIPGIMGLNRYTYFDPEKFAELIVQECIRVLEDLRGYSGVGENGNPYDTPSWNAALMAAKEVIISRVSKKGISYKI